MNPRLLVAAVCIPLFTSCYYRTHVRMVPQTNPDPPVLTMRVGENRKIASKTLLTEISMGFMFGPGYHMKSTDEKVVKIDGNGMEWTASAEALSPGTADVHYKDRYTRVVVLPAENGIAPR